GSVPTAAIKKLGEEYERAKIKIDQHFQLRDRQPTAILYSAYTEAMFTAETKYFLMYDELLDQNDSGPKYLTGTSAKQLIIDSWHHCSRQYDLTVYAICVMSNHVHVRLRANGEFASWPLIPLMEKHKRFTGRQLNQLHNCKGRRVWAEDTFDRDVRPGRFNQVLWYLINNPKKAGITHDPLAFPGTWWDPRLNQEFIDPYRGVAV
ncbi:MAG: transposase, partial [Bacteroidota bacterium]